LTEKTEKQADKMLDKTRIIQKIETQHPLMHRYGISKVGLFGSYARGQQHPESDIDLLVDFEDGQETFDNFMAACALFEGIFKGKKVEVVTLKGLSPHIGPYILKEVEYAKIAR
jgi:uncharacterized protein